MNNDLRHALVRAAEDAAIARIPPEMLQRMEAADRAYAARGGCPGCGSKTVGVHRMPCSELAKHPFD